MCFLVGYDLDLTELSTSVDLLFCGRVGNWHSTLKKICILTIKNRKGGTKLFYHSY